MYKPETRRELWDWIRAHFNLRLPYKVFTPGHSTPFDFVADAFFNPAKDLAAWANRSGLKTLSASVIAALEFRFTEQPLKGRVLSGSEDQASNLYDYWAQWCGTVLRGQLVVDPGRKRTRLKCGNFEILPASQKRVRGAKVQLLFRDEIDEIDTAVYGASVGMLDSREGLPSRTIDTSTWHYAHGPMGQLVADAESRGITLHKWNVWESIEQCPADRHRRGHGCLDCRLGVVCLKKRRATDPGSNIGIAADCCGLFSIDDAIKFLSQWSQGQWESEAECKRPTVEGLVYPEFDAGEHVRPDLDFDDDLPTYRAIDWGLNDFVCLWVQETKDGHVRVVDEYWANDTPLHKAAHDVQQMDVDGEGMAYPIADTYCDPAGRNRNDQTGISDVQAWGGITGKRPKYSTAGWSKEVRNGIGILKSFLRPAAGRTRLSVAPRCKMLIKAFESYRNRKVNNEYIEEPVKPQACDHPMDALRYYFVNRHSPYVAGVRTWSVT